MVKGFWSAAATDLLLFSPKITSILPQHTLAEAEKYADVSFASLVRDVNGGIQKFYNFLKESYRKDSLSELNRKLRVLKERFGTQIQDLDFLVGRPNTLNKLMIMFSVSMDTVKNNFEDLKEFKIVGGTSVFYEDKRLEIIYAIKQNAIIQVAKFRDMPLPRIEVILTERPLIIWHDYVEPIPAKKDVLVEKSSPYGPNVVIIDGDPHIKELLLRDYELPYNLLDEIRSPTSLLAKETAMIFLNEVFSRLSFD